MAHYIDEFLNLIEAVGKTVEAEERIQGSQDIVNKLKEAPSSLNKAALIVAITRHVSNKDESFVSDISAILKQCKNILIKQDANNLDKVEDFKIEKAMSLLDEINMQFDLMSIQRIMMIRAANVSMVNIKDILRKSTEILKKNEIRSMEFDRKQTELNSKFEELKKNQADIEEKQKNNQRDFVAVLGMFTTIIFAAFGGLQLLAEVFKGLNKTPLDVVLIHGSFVFISLILVLSLLFSGLSRMSDLPIRSCSCHEKKKLCSCSFATKHPTVFFSILMVSVITSFALVDKYFEFRKLLKGVITVENGVAWDRLSIMFSVSLLCLIPSLIIVALNILHKEIVGQWNKQ